MGFSILWLSLSILLLVLALAGNIGYKPKAMVDLVLYWSCSVLPQLFAPQLILISIALFSLNLAAGNHYYVATTNIVALLLLARVYRRGLQTGTTVQQGIDAAIADLDATVSTDRLTQVSRLPMGFRPFKFNHGNVEKLANISYGEHGKANLLDIYRPRQHAGEPLPVLLFLPGGAWVTGSKNDQGLPLINHMTENGWLCAAANYRLGPNHRFPTMLEDVFAAIAWLQANAQQYGGDAQFIAIAGNSAGGHLSTIAALAHPDTMSALGLANQNLRPNVVVSIYGRYDFLNRHGILPADGLVPFLTTNVMPGTPDECPQLWAMASPEDQINSDAPPMLMVHGDNDAMIPVEEARAFNQALASVSTKRVDYIEVPGAQHGYDLLCSSWALPTVYGIGQYLAAHYTHYLNSKTAT